MSMKHIWMTVVVLIVVLAGWFSMRPGPDKIIAGQSQRNVNGMTVDTSIDKPKVLFLNSYHQRYQWCSEKVDGMLKVFKGKLTDPDIVDGFIDNPECLVNLRIHHMDTKRNPSELFKLQAAQKAKDVIDQWQPDLIIFAEDNAAKYVIAPYYRNSDIPCVFCGINWDAGEYQFSPENVTGMLEVDLIEKTVEVLSKYAKGSRIGIIGEDNESNRKSTENYINKCGLEFEQVYYVKTINEWKAAYLDIQKDVDMLILEPPCFLLATASDAEKQDARNFVLENTVIPTGCVENWIAKYALVCLSKSSAEHGQWTAKTALRILSGESPKDIPIVENERVILYLNMPLARKQGYVFPVEMVEQAVLVN
ncbi:MAG: hypothetical protein JEZ07_09780 [Phycisphaerae bacterium]|nr:hypothetical protein [Phycisphaerae bacterium]